MFYYFLTVTLSVLFLPALNRPVSAGPFVQQAEITASDGAASDLFGFSVALEGSTLAVCARDADVNGVSNQGAAYIFTRGSNNTWTQTQKITASDGAADDMFGYTVDLEGDTLVIGVDDDDIGTNPNQGSIYVYTKSGSEWRLQQKMTASDGAADDHFAFPISVDGETIVAGSYEATVSGRGFQGAAYVFVRSGSTWTEQAKLTSSDGASMDFFGLGAAIQGDTVAIGAATADVGGETDQGAAYIFKRTGTTWSQQAKLVGSDSDREDNLGRALNLSGNTLVVGARNATVSGRSQQGAAYVFVESGGNWSQQAKLTASDGQTGDTFGDYVSIDGDRIVVFASKAGTGASGNGSLYIFERSGSSWTEVAKVTNIDGSGGITTGRRAVEVTGDEIALGVWYADISGRADQGAVHIYLPPQVLLSATSVSATEGGTTSTYTASLRAPPGSNVTVNLTADSQVTTSPSSLTFTPSNWNVAQTVTVAAVDDSAVEGAHSGRITHSSSSSDSNYQGLTIDSVTVSLSDNDTEAASGGRSTDGGSGSGSSGSGDSGGGGTETPGSEETPAAGASDGGQSGGSDEASAAGSTGSGNSKDSGGGCHLIKQRLRTH